MSVLVEAISIVTRTNTIAAKFPGGIKGYRDHCPNQTYCTDGKLIRVGFMVPKDVERFVGSLVACGLTFLEAGQAKDFVVVDQNKGPTTPCTWIDFGIRPGGDSHCWIKGADQGSFAAPSEHVPGGVKYHAPGSQHLQALGAEGNLDAFLDPATGKKLYLGRTGAGDSSPRTNVFEKAAKRASEKNGRWQIGELLGSEYPIQNIFRGGMGEVFVLYDGARGQLCAAKTFQDGIFQGPAGQLAYARFVQEAKAWINLGAHPNIVTAYDVRRIEDKPYVFSEFVEGGSLANLIKSGRLRRDIKRCIQLGVDICNGMIYANAHGVAAHRDLKPENCLLTSSGRLKITDFGLAKVLLPERGSQVDHPKVPQPCFGNLFRGLFGKQRANTPKSVNDGLTRWGTVAGTAPYMSPEQFRGLALTDVRADVYAFGVILYEMIQGSLPFSADSMEGFVRAHTTMDPPKIEGLPSSVWNGLAKCLNKTPAGRFQDFSFVLEWLENLLPSVSSSSPKLKPIDSKATNELARVLNLANLGQFHEALDLCTKILKDHPDDPEPWQLSGQLLFNLGQKIRALKALDRVCEIDPTRWSAWHMKGIILNATDDLVNAEVCYRKALALDNSIASVWYDLGVTLQQDNREDAAAEAWDQCLTIEPEHYRAWCNRGTIYMERKQFGHAVDCYQKSLKINPKDDKSWYCLGMALGYLGRIDEAIPALEKAKMLGFAQAVQAIDYFNATNTHS